ncbi:MAG: phosphoenolpyruvate-utilizing N-terminal domain-containing protein, partial [Candidatus Ornithomonoglobus sp.]
MIKYEGKGIYGAIAVGKLVKFKRDDAHIKRERISDIDAEKARFKAAKEKTVRQLEAVYEKAIKDVGEENAEIFRIHIMMLDDDDYIDSVYGIIEGQSANAEYAVAATADNFSDMFLATGDSCMMARSADVKDISDRVINNLQDKRAECVTDGGDKVII